MLQADPTMVAPGEFCELATAFAPCEFRVKQASAGWEREQAARLRRAVFCVEQGIFVGNDEDEVDAHVEVPAQTLVAMSVVAGMPDQVVGTVRIHQASPRHWWGSRLAVHAAFRRHGRLGATLIQLAVRSAHAQGCDEFLAHVQSQNVEMFERLHWKALGSEVLHGRLHALMTPDLDHYPPCHAPFVGLVARSVASRTESPA
jgi:putative N-acetyltransferase (TIGR04045 family)